MKLIDGDAFVEKILIDRQAAIDAEGDKWN